MRIVPDSRTGDELFEEEDGASPQEVCDINRGMHFDLDITGKTILQVGVMLAGAINDTIHDLVEDDEYHEQFAYADFRYNELTHMGTMQFELYEEAAHVERGLISHSVRVYLSNGAEVFGVDNGYNFALTTGQSVEFPNLWSRSDIFVHASFVSGTSFQYLGRNGDFFPKPSKMWSFTGNSTEFQMWLTQDGKKPIDVKDVSFIVELTFIYSNSEYQAE